MEAHHFFQFGLAGQKLIGIKHDVAEIQILGVAKPMSAITADDEDVSRFQFVIFYFRHMGSATPENEYQFGVLVGVHFEVPVVLNEEDAEAKVFFRHILFEGAVALLFVQASIYKLMCGSDDFIDNFRRRGHDYRPVLRMRFCQLVCTNSESKWVKLNQKTNIQHENNAAILKMNARIVIEKNLIFFYTTPVCVGFRSLLP